MIRNLLQLEPSGAGRVPNALLTTVKCRADECIQGLHILGSGEMADQDFSKGLNELKDKFEVLTVSVAQLQQIKIGDLDRNALVALLVELAIGVRHQFEATDRDFVDTLHRAIGEVPTLHWAAEKGHSKVAELLLNHGAIVDATDNFGRQPIHRAAGYGHKEVVELLLNRGAKVDAADRNGMQPIHFAAEIGQVEVVELLLKRGATVHAAANDGMQPLHAAVGGGHKEVAKRLLSRGASVMATLSDGCQPIHWAVVNGHEEIVELLLTRGAYVLAATKDGFQPMRLTDNAKIVEQLKRAIELEPLFKVYREKGYLTRFIDKKRFPIDRSYINLAIVDQDNFEETERRTRKQDRFLAENFFFDHPKCIELTQLFASSSRIYIEGDAGSGKTTLCHYLAFSWATLTAEERLHTLGPWANEYDAVIWIPLREIQTLPKEATLQDLVSKLYPGLVIDIIKCRKTLYILDSFDEVVSLEETCKNSEADKRWEIVNSLIDQPHWLMTSRPGLFSERFSMSRRLKNLGFTEKNIQSYIQRFSDDFRISDKTLSSELFKSPDLKALAHVPLHLELVCSLWKENPTILGKLSNPLALYDQMATNLFSRHIKRLQRSETPLPSIRVSNHKDVFKYRVCLEKIAFISRHLGSNRITPAIYERVLNQDPLDKLSDEELNEFGKRLFEDLGFLAPRGDVKDLFCQDYAFLHTTFEEYFAARHVVAELGSSGRLANGETADEWLKANCLLKEKEMVIDFIASLVHSDAQLNLLAEELKRRRKVDESQSGWQYPLHRSVSMGLLPLAEALISKHVKVDSANNEGWQPIHLAVQMGQRELVELLVDRGACADATLKDGRRPLHLAAMKGNRGVVELLIKMGAKVDAVQEDGREPLHWAVQNGHKEVVELLVNQRTEVDTANEKISQLLQLAALNGHKEVVDLLISKGAKHDRADRYGRKPLYLAALNGHEEVVELLFKMGAKLDAPDKDGREPLHIAAQKGHREIVKLLLSKDANLHVTDKNGREPLHLAAQKGHKEVVELLMSSRGAQLDATDKNGLQPLHTASQEGHKEIVELLISRGAKLDAPEKGGLQPLHIASQRGHKEIVDLLISSGAKMDSKEKNGREPLHLAAQNGHKEVVELLISRGAKVNATDQNRLKPLHLAALRGHQELLELLCSKSVMDKVVAKDPLQHILLAAVQEASKLIFRNLDIGLAAAKGRSQSTIFDSTKKFVEGMKLFLSIGPIAVSSYLENSPHTLSAFKNVFKKSKDWFTRMGGNVDSFEKWFSQMLSDSVKKGDKIVVEQLICNGAKLDIPDKEGRQPLHFAVLKGHLKIVDLLLRKGAKVDAPDKNCRQPLHIAAQKGHFEITELLLNEGANVDAAEEDGWQPLHWAALNGHLEVAEILIRKSGSVNAAGKDGRQPLHLAAVKGHKDLAELLIRSGAKVDVVAGEDKWQPLHIAAQNGHKEFLELLLRYGAKFDAPTIDGREPLQLAAAKGHKEVVEFLVSKGAK